VTLCPVCQSARTLIRVDRRRLARCLQCGAGWVQEGAWQHSITRSSEGQRAPLDVITPVAAKSSPAADQRAVHAP
jgi:Zn-finger nucleic acid-binding protein